MASAKEIIERFGGQTALAKLLGKGQSTVAYWAKTGIIPAKWQPELISIAIKNGINLSAHDFVGSTNIQDESGKQAESVVISSDKNTYEIPLEPIIENSPFMFYAASDGAIKVQVLVGDETVWATQQGMAEIFDSTKQNISYHLTNIFNELELDKQAVVKEILTTASDGKDYPTAYYSLDAIISVGYRISSYRATQFRKWATEVLRGYLIKGYALNDDRLKQGNRMFGKDYFDELLDKIREIRASERRFYQKITDLYAQCSIDYDKDSPITQHFYAHVQDKLHFAIHGHTSAELMRLRANSSKPHMGLAHWKNEGRGGKITKADVTVGKNYLNHEELKELERLVSMYLDWAENFARRQKALTMKDWAEKLDGFLEFNAYEILKDFGRVKRSDAERHAIGEYEKFRVVQDMEYKSDFDKVIDEIKIRQIPHQDS